MSLSDKEIIRRYGSKDIVKTGTVEMEDVKTFISQYKKDFRKEIKEIPPELNKEKMLNQVDFIMWGLFEELAGSKLT